MKERRRRRGQEGAGEAVVSSTFDHSIAIPSVPRSLFEAELHGDLDLQRSPAIAIVEEPVVEMVELVACSFSSAVGNNGASVGHLTTNGDASGGASTRMTLPRTAGEEDDEEELGNQLVDWKTLGLDPVSKNNVHGSTNQTTLDPSLDESPADRVNGDHQERTIEPKSSNRASLTTKPMMQPDLPNLTEYETAQLNQLYRLPPVDRNLTALEQEFRDMLEFFSQFSEADFLTIRDPRLRTIFEGVIASSEEPAVYRAFEVLFEDLVPLRIAGRMIFSKMKQIILKASSRGQTEVDAIVTTTGLPAERVEVSRLAFLTMAVATEQGHDEEAHLSLDQLVDSGLAETAMTLLGYDNLEDFLNNIDQDQRGKVSFAEFMVGLQMIAEEACALDTCDPAVVLQSVVAQLDPTISSQKVKLDKKRQEYCDRYDQMVAAFQDWSDVVPTGEGRRLDVLRGCFVGAANKRVVAALRVVYIDYAALRVAGNSIFALMQALVTQLRKGSNK